VRSVIEAIRQECVVGPAAHPGRQLLVTADPAAVLGRRLVEHRFDLEHVVPAVAEVVLVPELVALDGHQLVQAHVVLQHALLALVDVEARDEVRRVVITPGAEPVQVAVGPPAEHGIQECPLLPRAGACQQLSGEILGVGRWGHDDQSTLPEDSDYIVDALYKWEIYSSYA